MYLLCDPQVAKADSKKGHEAEDNDKVWRVVEEEAQGGDEGDEGEQDEDGEETQLPFSLTINSSALFTISLWIGLKQILPFDTHSLHVWLFVEDGRRANFLRMSALACCTRNVLGKGGRPYLSVRKKWESLDGGGWCRHDPAIPYQTCPPTTTPSVPSRKPVGLDSDAHSGHDRRHQLAGVQVGKERRVLRPRPGLQEVVAALWAFCRKDFRASPSLHTREGHGW